MTDILTAGGFETDDAAWTWTLGAARSQDDPRTGDWHAAVLYSNEPPIPERIGSVKQTLTTAAGNAYVISGHVQMYAGTGDLYLQIAGSTVKTFANADASGTGTYDRFWHAFMCDATSTEVKFIVENMGLHGANAWYIDDLEVHRMPIEWSERVIDLIESTISDNLSTKLSAIESEQGDGLSLPVPAAAGFHKMPKAEAAGQDTIEIFEQDTDVVMPYTDLAAGRITYDMPVAIRWTIHNRTPWSKSDRTKVLSRCKAALLRVFVSEYRLGATDDSILVFRATSIQGWPPEADESGQVRKMGFTMNGVAKVAEIND